LDAVALNKGRKQRTTWRRHSKASGIIMSKPEEQVISLDIDVTYPATVIQREDGSLWLTYRDKVGDYHTIPITITGLGHLLGSRTTLATAEGYLVDPKDINRLITSVYPTGKVYVQDDFEATAIGSYPRYGSNGQLTEIITTKSFQGAKCFHLQAPAGGYAGFQLFQALPPKSRRWGMECWIQIPPAANLDHFFIQFSHYGEGAVGAVPVAHAAIKFVPTAFNATYNHLTGKWQYRTTGDTYVDFLEPYYIYTHSANWNYFKLVADFGEEKYVKAILGRRVVEMPYDLFKVTTGNEPNIFATNIRVAATSAGTMDLFCDNLVLTVEEP